MNIQYSEQVALLLTLGQPDWKDDWQETYQQLGFSKEHIPDLIKMITDENLLRLDSKSDAVWAPVHAWRILGQLRAAEAIPVLIAQLFRIDEDDDDWVGEELPKVFALIGEPAIRRLSQYLADAKNHLYARAAAADGLAYIAKSHQELRQNCSIRLEKALVHYAENDKTLNGFLVAHLIDLKAVETMPVIQEAYKEGCVDLSICGDLEEVEIEFGIREHRSTPRPRLWMHKLFSPEKSKVGRNDPCPCGSGKKYKKCCWNE